MTSQTMNRINCNQNKEEILMCLFSQRKIYDNAKNYTYINWIINFIIFFIGIIITKLLKNKLLILIIGIIEIILFLFSIYIDKKVKNLNILAATTQEFVDRNIYEFEINKRELSCIIPFTIKSKTQDMKDKYEAEYNIQKNSNGYCKPSGVKDWYINIPDNIDKYKAILKCQEQNIYWDKQLIYTYKKIIEIVIIIFIILFILINLNNVLSDVLISIISIFPISKQIIEELQSAKEYIKNSEELKVKMDTLKEIGVIQEDNLKDIQLSIYKRRCSNFNVPSFIYNIINKKLHKEYSRNN